MVPDTHTRSTARAEMLEWTAGIGAVTAEALAERRRTTVQSARAMLGAAERERLLKRARPLAGEPALYALTGAGMRACGLQGLALCRVTAMGARHLIVCAAVAAALERCYPDHRVVGERELRRDERRRGARLASTNLVGPCGSRTLHRPDLVLWPRHPAGLRPQLPIAVEVELTVKAPRRLAEICRAWARCRCVAGVLYLVARDVEGPLQRAIESADAAERVVALPLDALPGWERPAAKRIERTVPGAA